MFSGTVQLKSVAAGHWVVREEEKRFPVANQLPAAFLEHYRDIWTPVEAASRAPDSGSR